MHYCLLYFLLLSSLFSSVDEPNTGWSYVQSSTQVFYIFIDGMNIVDEEGVVIEGYGDGTNSSISQNSDCVLDPSSCDVVGAFLSHELDLDTCNAINGIYSDGTCDVCVGWVYYNSYTPNPSNGSISTTLLVNGYDTSSTGIYDYYCENGDTPNLKFYDASDSKIYSLSPNQSFGPFFNLELYVYYPDCSDTSSSDCEELWLTAESVEDLNNSPGNLIPDSFEILSIYPNPFNPSTKISYTLNKINYIAIEVYDTIGNQLEVLYDGIQEPGQYEISWIPTADISSGTYFVMINTPDNKLINKVTYIK